MGYGVALTMFHNLLGDLVREFCCGCMQPLGVGNSLVERSVAETARKAGPASSTERSEPDELGYAFNAPHAIHGRARNQCDEESQRPDV